MTDGDSLFRIKKKNPPNKQASKQKDEQSIKNHG